MSAERVRAQDLDWPPAVGAGWVEPGWLSEVRLRAARRVLWLRELWSAHRYEGEQLLPISHSEIDRALLAPGSLEAAERAFYREDERAAVLTKQISALRDGPPDPAWRHLCQTLGVGPEEQTLLALGLAGAFDPSMKRVFGYLLDLSEPADPTPALAGALFDHTRWCTPGPDSALVRWLLARPLRDGRDPYTSSTAWEADALLLGPLLGPTGPLLGPLGTNLAGTEPTGAPGTDPAAAPGDQPGSRDSWAPGTTGVPVNPPGSPVLRPDTVAGVMAFLKALLGPSGEAAMPIQIEIVGPLGSGKTSLAAQVARGLGCDLLAIDAGSIAAALDPAAAAVRELRRARLERAAVIWERADLLPEGVWPLLALCPLSFVASEAELATATGSTAVRRSLRLPRIGRRERIRLWSSLTPAPAPAPVTDWALRPAEVRVAASVAPAGPDAVRDVCHRLLMARTPELLSRLPLPHRWEDLVLAPRTLRHLREIEAQARHRGEVLDDWGFARLVSIGRGVTALFAGPSGTGKTMTAQVMARSLGLDLYRVDLSGVVSKYIGETEKHLREVFDACERAPILLLFDEADALFGKRTQVNDAHDRYANIEVDYVLQRMESFDGLAILATNRKGDLDTAFLRRLRFIVDFAPPGPADRQRLWRLALTGSTEGSGGPRVGGIAWALLAEQFNLTGAGIKSAALAAAFLAREEGSCIGMPHVIAAARRELEKQGIVVRPAQMPGQMEQR
jgi:hypothetical protein